MSSSVTLVIPGRNCATTIGACLGSAVPLKQQGSLDEIIFVNDASTDATEDIVSDFDVIVLPGPGRGAAAARNVGWQHAKSPLIWFIDSDCVIEPGALDRLLSHVQCDRVGAVGGSYVNRRPDSILACLIHEEIIERHRVMPNRVDFLGGFNVLYRRAILEAVGGFDEAYPGATAEDADLSFRVRRAGYELGFEPASRVGHYHETSLLQYLRTQRRHGYWRVRLHATHRGQAMGNDYSGLLDHAQPPLALITLMTIPLAFWASLRWIPLAPALLILMMQLPMTAALLGRRRSIKYILFAPMGFVRAFWRGVGLAHGVVAALAAWGRGQPKS